MCIIPISCLLDCFNFSDSDYGKKKKKRGGGRAKKTKSVFPKKLQRGGGSRRRRDWSDESDFSDRPRKKKSRNTIPSADLDRSNIVESAGRRTRGVKVNYSLLEGSSDEGTPEPAKGKGKGPRKWDGSEDEFKPDSDVLITYCQIRGYTTVLQKMTTAEVAKPSKLL